MEKCDTRFVDGDEIFNESRRVGNTAVKNRRFLSRRRSSIAKKMTVDKTVGRTLDVLLTVGTTNLEYEPVT